jgi:hypothetical protein
MNKTKIGRLFTVFLLFCVVSFISLNGQNKRQDLPGEEKIGEALAELENMYEQLEEWREELDKKSFSPEALVDVVDDNLEALYQWVRDNTLLVPYRGTLRGPRGVLMDRVGNSLDRALLLNELLYEAGYEVRLARSTLPDDEAGLLLQKLRQRAKSFPFPEEERGSAYQNERSENFSLRFDMDKGRLDKDLNDQIEAREALEKKIQSRAEKQAEALALAVKNSGAVDYVDHDARNREALKEHWWVHASKNGTWVDLDPSFSDFKPGQTLSNPDAFFDAHDLDEEEAHLIHIRLIIEQWESGEVSEKTVLEHTIQPDELFDSRILIRHYPLDWPTDKTLFEAEDLILNLKNVIFEQKTWVPTLTVDSDEIQGTMFNHTGALVEKKSGSGGVGAFSRSLFRAFGAQDKKEEPAKDSYLTAEWIEYEICSPGQPARTIRREVFDILGPAQRAEENISAPDIKTNGQMNRCLSMLGETEVLIITSRFSTEFLEYLTVENLLSNQETILELFTGLKQPDLQQVLNQIAEITSPPGKMYDLALARSKFGWAKKGIFLDHPNLISFHSQLRLSPEGKLVKCRSMDIIENDVSVIQEQNFLIRLSQGVLDTNIESLIMPTEEKVFNTSEVFNEGSEWITLAGVEDKGLTNLELDEDSSKRIKQDLENGYLVIAPKKAFKINGEECPAWWRIDPETGHTLGIGTHGQGQAIVEYAEVAQTMIQLKLQIESYMDIFNCIMNAAAYALAGGNTTEQNKLAVAKCIWDTVCNYMLGKLTGHLLADTIWSNFIVEKTVDWLNGKFCGLAY